MRQPKSVAHFDALRVNLDNAAKYARRIVKARSEVIEAAKTYRPATNLDNLYALCKAVDNLTRIEKLK